MCHQELSTHKYIYRHINFYNKNVLSFPGSITCAAYPLSQIDTIDIETGKISKNSALNLVVFGVSCIQFLYEMFIAIANIYENI